MMMSGRTHKKFPLSRKMLMNDVESECERGGGGNFYSFAIFTITRWNAIKMELMLECVLR
jgi:hypothetical protein